MLFGNNGDAGAPETLQFFRLFIYDELSSRRLGFRVRVREAFV
jgi:hypothetical protein